LPSRRYRSRKSLGTRLNKIRYSVSKSENTSIPSVVGNNAVNTYSFAKNAVSTDYMTSGSVDSTTYSLSAYLPGGEANQRVPAPLTDVIYWTQVVEGRVELHQSGIHGDGELEDIQNVFPGLDGLIFDPTEGVARIYLTGRLDLPKSRKIYSTWESDASIPIKIIYWEQTPEYFVESAYRSDGITHLDLSDITHALSVGDLITVTKTTDDFDGLYRVVEVKADYVSAITYEQRYTLTVDDSAYDVDTNTATFTLSGENPTVTVIRPNDLVVLSSVAGYESLAGPHRVLTVDDTTTANTIVLTFSGLYPSDVNDFYNTVSATVYTGVPLDTVNQQNFNPLGSVSEDIYHYIELEDRTVWGADGYTFPITQASLLNGIVTITTPYAHYASVDDTITVIGLDASTGQGGLFDRENAPITSVNAFAKTITYRTYTGVAPTNSYGPTTSTVDATAITQNQYIARQYAVYAEVPQGNVIKTLSKAKVFEIIGEPSIERKFFDITYLDTTAPPFYVTLSAPVEEVPEFITLYFDDPAINANVSGTWAVSSVIGSDVYFTTGVVSPPSYDQSTTGELYYSAGVRNYEISPDGIIFYDKDGAVETRLGSGGLDEITLSNASINVSGVASVTSLYTGAVYSTQPSFFEENTTFNSEIRIYSTLTNTTNNLYGTADLARYHDLSNAATNSPYAPTSSVVPYTGDILNRFARGLVYSVNFGQLTGPAANSFTFVADRTVIAAGSFTLDADRNYLFTISFGTVRFDSLSNARSRIEFIASSDAAATGNYSLNTMTTSNAVYIKQAIHYAVPTTGTTVADPIPPMIFDYTSTATALTNGMTDYLVQSGVEIFWQVRYAYALTAHTTSVIRSIDVAQQGKAGLSIYDMGPAIPAQIGSINSGEGRYVTSGSFAGGGGSGTTFTATAEGLAAISGSWTNFASGSSTSSLYQGKSGSSARQSMISFPDFRTTITPAIVDNSPNFTITKVEVYLKNRSSYLSGGLSTSLGYVNFAYTSIGGGGIKTFSIPPTLAAIATNGFTPVSASFTRGQGQYVTLSSQMLADILTPSSTGKDFSILLSLIDDDPDTYDTTTANYGYFDGRTQSDPPKIRYTYTYTA
jgi:hypothetical protein